MSFAITLLVVLAIASVIGTVLQQNLPWNDYIIKFGPFWFEVFRQVELYNVYASSWFMLILLVLLVSTSTCILRNWPAMQREMRNWRDRMQHRSLRAMAHNAHWQSDLAPTPLAETASALLTKRGYRTRIKSDDTSALVTARLPFTIEVEEFRVEHHITGQPKSFESDLVIHDDELDEPLRQTIRVNHPLVHRGYTLYQSSFGDGGTGVRFSLWPLDGGTPFNDALDGIVKRNIEVVAADGPRTVELDDFRLFNINAVEGDDGELEQRNFGPAVQFRVRQSNGQAIEYFNYMAPVMINGVSTLLSGRRASVAEEFEYLHIPADKAGGPGRLMNLVATLQSTDAMRRIVRVAVLGEQAESASTEQLEMADTMSTLVPIFLERGFAGVEADIESRVPEAQRDTVREAYLRVLQRILTISYLDVLAAEGIFAPDEFDERWLENAINALNGLSVYGAPFYLQLTNFTHRESTGLQIAKSPGKAVVYFGSTLLMIGVFLQFYVQQRRLWLSVQRDDAGRQQVAFAGVPERDRAAFDHEFAVLSAGLEAHTAQPNTQGDAT